MREVLPVTGFIARLYIVLARTCFIYEGMHLFNVSIVESSAYIKHWCMGKREAGAGNV
jgi:hypothetical protein